MTWRVEVGRNTFMLGDLTGDQQTIERQLGEGVGEFGTPCQSLRQVPRTGRGRSVRPDELGSIRLVCRDRRSRTTTWSPARTGDGQQARKGSRTTRDSSRPGGCYLSHFHADGGMWGTTAEEKIT